MKRIQAETPGALTGEEKETIESLLQYPSLEHVFDASQPHNLAATRKKMQASVAELERIVRSGSKTEADRAERIIAAYKTTADFIDELERLRGAQAG